MINRNLFVLLLAMATGSLMHCSSPKKVTVADEIPAEAPAVIPVDLKVEPGNERMTIEWKQQGDGLISGYNIYISESPTLSDTAAPVNFAPYPGDTDPDDGVERYEAGSLENGKKYFVTVRVINPDRTLSAPSNQAMTICGPRGEILLESRFAGEQDGYVLARAAYVRSQSDQNDLYFYNSGGTDYLASPDRLDGYNRKSRFSKLSLKGSLAEIRSRVSNVSEIPKADRIAVNVGDWIHVRTADNRNGLLHVVGFAGEGKSRGIRLEIAFCPAENEMIF